jgi:hypothetical protein
MAPPSPTAKIAVAEAAQTPCSAAPVARFDMLLQPPALVRRSTVPLSPTAQTASALRPKTPCRLRWIGLASSLQPLPFQYQMTPPGPTAQMLLASRANIRSTVLLGSGSESEMRLSPLP